MKRFHVNVAVDDLAQSVRFYSTLFATQPTVLKPDYAKWMLEDPRVNFSISTASGRRPGISHLGIQAEDESELAEIYGRLAEAERPVVEEKATTCCYARSDKQWIADPQGVEWETFYTYGESTVYGTSGANVRTGALSGGIATCGCGPAETAKPEPQPVEAAACCAD
jgi:catechol 2,3-dioxygenase-like lactoylglutathione lyase family enzyme